ncbi:hypothetical protein KAM447_40370 [Aeromonas caviae]|nr:hypothetical protein KAM447_40370 [Aeromonas caviae]
MSALRIRVFTLAGMAVQLRRNTQHCHDGLSPEQTKVINRLLDGGEQGFENGISASQYQKVAGVSKPTATRHLAQLLDRGCIEKLPGGGRSTRYQIRWGDIGFTMGV